MPPRYVYWTIIVDGQPTAFRSGSLEDIMPTFNRLKEKQPNAELKWFQNGQLWPSRHDAQDFMRARGERGRAKDPRQSPSAEATGDKGGDADRPKTERAWNAKPEWKTRSSFSPRSDKAAWKPKGGEGAKPEWKPKGTFTPHEKPARSSWGEGEDRPSIAKAAADRPAGQARSDHKPEWKPKGTFKPKESGHGSGWGEKPGWKVRPRPASRREDKPAWTPKGSAGGKPEWKPKGTFRPAEEGHRPSSYAKATVHKSARDQARSSFRPKSFTPSFAKASEGRPNTGAVRTRSAKARDQKLEWNPKAESRPGGPNAGFAKSDPGAPKRKWVPKAEYKKSLGIEAKRDDKWRPGGEHKDPKQKYKDAKKAKWTKFKANIRARSTKPRKQEE